tara:strand:+ start:169 stop:948 length:780 start_codon:yes stop_codon:yes gene_type:complete
MFNSGQCYPTDERLHPFVHIMLHAQTDPLDLPSKALDPWLRVWWDIRGRPFGWSLSSIRTASEDVVSMVSWVNRQPSLLSWFQSNQAFRAPAKWPPEVERAFSPLPLVTPWEYANACPPLPPGGCSSVWLSHQASILWCYSSGMPLSLLATHLCVPIESVEREMVRAVKLLRKHGPFVIWALDADTEFEDLAAGTGLPLMQRLQMHQKICKDPLRSPRHVFEPLMKNGRFWQRVRSGWYCSKAGSRKVRKNIMVAGPEL